MGATLAGDQFNAVKIRFSIASTSSVDEMRSSKSSWQISCGSSSSTEVAATDKW